MSISSRCYKFVKLNALGRLTVSPTIFRSYYVNLKRGLYAAQLTWVLEVYSTLDLHQFPFDRQLIWICFEVDKSVRPLKSGTPVPSTFPESTKLKVVLQTANWELEATSLEIEQKSDFGVPGLQKSAVFIKIRLTRDPSFYLCSGTSPVDEYC